MRKPNFKTPHPISENVIMLEMEKNEIIYDKPTYTGFTILEISKCWLYHLFYNVVLPHFNDVVLSYVDTDSMIFETSSGNNLNNLIRSLFDF